MTLPLPEMNGREHWLMAEALLVAAQAPGLSTYAIGALTARAQAHATLAQAAPAYGLHVPPRDVVADSPNILPGKDEAPVPTRVLVGDVLVDAAAREPHSWSPGCCEVHVFDTLACKAHGRVGCPTWFCVQADAANGVRRG